MPKTRKKQPPKGKAEAKSTLSQREGTLVIIGGHEDKENECVILQEVAKLLQGGKLVIATIASEEPAEYFRAYKKAFGKLDTPDLVEIYVADRHESLDEKKLEIMDGASGIYFTGGDQLRISSQIGDTPFEKRVIDIY